MLPLRSLMLHNLKDPRQHSQLPRAVSLHSNVRRLCKQSSSSGRYLEHEHPVGRAGKADVSRGFPPDSLIAGQQIRLQPTYQQTAVDDGLNKRPRLP